jgi:hypothetical protein
MEVVNGRTEGKASCWRHSNNPSPWKQCRLKKGMQKNYGNIVPLRSRYKGIQHGKSLGKGSNLVS